MAGNGKKKKRVRRLPEGGSPAALRDWLTQAWALGNTPVAPSIYSSLSLAVSFLPFEPFAGCVYEQPEMRAFKTDVKVPNV